MSTIYSTAEPKFSSGNWHLPADFHLSGIKEVFGIHFGSAFALSIIEEALMWLFSSRGFYRKLVLIGLGLGLVLAAKDLPPHTNTADFSSVEAEVDTETPLKTGIQNVDQMNRVGDKALSTETCVECAKPQVRTYESCSSRNNYLENSLSSVLNSSAYSAFFQSPQKEIITESCIQKNMSVFPNSTSYFRYCGPRQYRPSRRVLKACLSENYVNVTAKSFNLAADCLGDYVSGSNLKNQVALSIFSLMSVESGMNVNAMSGTGPGGPGQMSGGAIQAVNFEMRSIQEHLKESENPNCRNVLGKALATPMSPGRVCDRIGLSSGNPLKSMAYAFAYQAVNRRFLEKFAFDSGVYRGVLSNDLPDKERERLIMEVSAWSHNTGGAGMLTPLRALMWHYLQSHRKVRTREDVTAFLQNLRTYLSSHAHPANRSRRRRAETMNYYRNIQKRMSLITEDSRLCLAN